MLQCAEDFLVDIPKLWEYLAELLEPLFEEAVVHLSFLGPLSSFVSSSLAANFIAAVLKELVNQLQVGTKAFCTVLLALFVSTNTAYRIRWQKERDIK